MSGSNILSRSGATGCMSKAGLAEGTNPATIRIAAPNGAGVDFAIDGLCYHRADADNIAVSAHNQQAVSTTCLYLVQVDGSGTVSTKKGEERLTASLGDNMSVQWPMPDADKCPMGAYKIATNDSTPFTNGTTDIGAAGITATFYDFALAMPNAPVVS